jgi:hypothetical protein
MVWTTHRPASIAAINPFDMRPELLFQPDRGFNATSRGNLDRDEAILTALSVAGHSRRPGG